MEILAMPIAEQLKQLRTAASLTQQQLATAAGLSWSVVAQIEQGTNKDPRLSTLRALAKALGTTIDALAPEGPPSELKTKGKKPKSK